MAVAVRTSYATAPTPKVKQAVALLAEMWGSPAVVDQSAPPSVNFTRAAGSSKGASKQDWFGVPHLLLSTADIPNINAASLDDPYFWVDSGATHHVTPHRTYFTTYTPYTTPWSVRVGDNRTIPALGYGDVLLSTAVDGMQRELRLQGVLHVPGDKSLLDFDIAAERGWNRCAGRWSA